MFENQYLCMREHGKHGKHERGEHDGKHERDGKRYARHATTTKKPAAARCRWKQQCVQLLLIENVQANSHRKL